MKRIIFLLLVVFSVLGAAYAHHSLAASYDGRKTIRLDGKLAEFAFRNPHSFLFVDAKDKDGKVQRYSLEWRGSGALGQQGIKRDTLKIGDEVAITMNPSRTPADFKGLLVTLHRKSDGFGWGTNPGEVVD